MKVASSYPGKIQGEAQERLYELWQAFDLDYDEKLDWLLAGLERLAQKHLLPNPRVFVRFSFLGSQLFRQVLVYAR